MGIYRSEKHQILPIGHCFCVYRFEGEPDITFMWDDLVVVDSQNLSMCIVRRLGGVGNTLGIGGIICTLARGVSVGSCSGNSSSACMTKQRILPIVYNSF